MLYGSLKLHGLEFFPLISFNDITFTCIELNFNLIILAMSGLTWIFLWLLLGKDKWLHDLKSKVSKPIDNFFNKYQKKKIASRLLLLLILLVGSALVTFTLFLLFSTLSSADIYLRLIFIIVPVSFILFQKKRNLILLAHMVIMFFWVNVFIDDVLEKTKIDQKDYSPEYEITFNSDKEQITSSDSLQWIFYGYENLVLFDKTKQEYLLFKTNHIDNVRFLKKIDDST